MVKQILRLCLALGRPRRNCSHAARHCAPGDELGFCRNSGVGRVCNGQVGDGVRAGPRSRQILAERPGKSDGSYVSGGLADHGGM
jgi:hypothetical protein